MFLPEITFASITWFASLVTMSLVPLHKPSDWSIFLSSIICVPILSFILWLGSPEVVRVFKNSGVNTSKASLPSTSDLSTESALKYSFSSPIKH